MLSRLEAVSWFRRTRDRHIIVLKDYGVGYARVPKAANTRIKVMLAARLGVLKGAKDEGTKQAVSSDRFWLSPPTGGAEMVTPSELARDWPGTFVFTVVRNPFSRLVSCYESKILAPEAVSPGMRRSGMTARMRFGEFVETVAATPDRRADIHYRSQADILTHEGAIVPHFIARFEQLPADWERLRAILGEEHGLRLPAWPERRAEPDRKRLTSPWTGSLVALVRQRYEADFRLFYPDAEDPI